MSRLVVSLTRARQGVTVYTDRLNHIDIDSRLVTLRFGIFFDGTGNNADNAEMGVQCRALMPNLPVPLQQMFLLRCPPGMLGLSQDNAPSNVAKLFDLYRSSEAEAEGVESGDYFIRLYVPGIGTSPGKPDDPEGLAEGAGETGVLERVKESIDTLIWEALDDFKGEFPDAWIEAVEFDVFGFSRGAAAARHFVNEVRKPQQEQNPLVYVLVQSGINLADGWLKNLRVRFVGLFESVLNIHFRPELGDPALARGEKVALALPAGCAEQVIQLRARDEHRHNFPLTSATPTWKEVSLPGVHSDIGGGYLPQKTEDLFLSPIFVSSEPRLVPLKMTRAYRQAAQALAKFQAQDLVGLADPETKLELWVSEGSPDTPVNWRHFGGLMRQVFAAVRLRRKVGDAYALVTLRVMHKLAADAGVQFRPIEDSDPAYALPAELEPIAKKLMADTALSAVEERLLRYKYLHHSAHWNPSLPAEGTILHIDRPADDGKRMVYGNEGGRLAP